MRCIRLISLILAFALSGSYVGCARVVSARAFLYSDEGPMSDGPHSYLVFTGRPGPKTMPRAMAVCDSYLRNLEPLARLGRPATDVVFTYWVLSGSSTEPVAEDCGTLVSAYDYARAAGIASAVDLPGAAGPLLVAYPKIVHNTETADILLFDLSDFSDHDLDRAFGIWKDRVGRDPATWDQGFRLLLIREAFRNFLERYGNDVIRIVRAG